MSTYIIHDRPRLWPARDSVDDDVSRYTSFIRWTVRVLVSAQPSRDECGRSVVRGSVIKCDVRRRASGSSPSRDFSIHVRLGIPRFDETNGGAVKNS